MQEVVLKFRGIDVNDMKTFLLIILVPFIILFGHAMVMGRGFSVYSISYILILLIFLFYPQTAKISDDGILMGHSEGKNFYKWDYIHGYKIKNNVIVVYIGGEELRFPLDAKVQSILDRHSKRLD